MIEVHGVSKLYGSLKALDDISFEVARGEVLGFLGPNGAGKSTTMKVLTTFVSATSGTAVVDGFDVHAQPELVRARIGYLPETPPLYGDMAIEDYLRFVGRARGLKGKELSRRLDAVAAQTGLTKRLKSPIRELSKGFKQRTGLAQALIHDPKVLILDEPTSGLDPMQIIEIRKLIRRLAEHHVVVFSTHILSEADAISDRLVIINRGRIVANGTSAELASSAVSEQKVQLVVSGLPDALTGDLSEIEEVTGVDVRRAAEGYAKFILTVKGGARQLRAACEQAASLAYVRGRAVAEISPQLVTLEEVFLRLLRETSEPIEAHSVAATSLEEEGGEVPDTSKGDLEVYPIPVSPVEKPSSGPDTSFGDESESDRRMAELRNIRPDTTSIAFEERADSGEFSVRPETGAADGDKGSGNGGDVALEPKDWEDA